MEMGAGTFHPATVLRALGPDAWRAAYVQPCRRPTDGRYGENPNRLGAYYQYQVVLKPSPDDLQDLYLGSLVEIGIDPAEARHPLRRGRLGEPDARCLGARLGSVVRRDGGDPIHLFPAGRRVRMQAGHRRAHLRPRAAGDVYPGRRQRVRPAVQRCGRDLRRRVPRERGRDVDLQFRGRRHRRACSTCSARRPPNASVVSPASCRSPLTSRRSRPATCSIPCRRAASSVSPNARPISAASAISPRRRAAHGWRRLPGRERLMADFLLELLSEEIPARMQAKARNDLVAAVRRMHECGRPDDGDDRSLFDPAAAGADCARRRGRDRGEPRGGQGTADIGAGTGAGRVPAQDRPHAQDNSRSATASISR